MAEKIYVLDPRPAPEPVRPAHAAKQARAAVPQVEEPRPESWIKPQAQAPAPTSAQSRKPFHPGRTVVALYTLGGVAPLALRVGPRKFLWASLWTLALAAWGTLGWFWTELRAYMESARPPILPFLVGLVLVHGVGTLAWSRAIARTLRDERFHPENLPREVREPWVAALIGLCVPGAGLALAGRATRAALALWTGAQVLFGALVVSHAGLLWRWNIKSGADAVPKTFLEAFLVASAAMVVVGGLFWIAAALDGARVALGRHGRRAADSVLAPGDAVALGLLASLVLLVVTVSPTQLARDLDAFASALRFEEYRLIPLGLESTAAVLDPGRPEYAMRVAELHTDLGNPAKAQAIHDRLRERWEAYAQMLLETAATTGSVLPQPVTPIQPAADLVRRVPELGPQLAPVPARDSVTSPAGL
jgi:hypothetical protein